MHTEATKQSPEVKIALSDIEGPLCEALAWLTKADGSKKPYVVIGTSKATYAQWHKDGEHYYFTARFAGIETTYVRPLTIGSHVHSVTRLFRGAGLRDEDTVLIKRGEAAWGEALAEALIAQ